MADQKIKEPIKKITDAASQAARAESEPPHVRSRRAVIFQFVLIGISAAFAILIILVEANPVFAIDLKITRAVQLINFKPFDVLMTLVSWPGFVPQSFIITLLLVLLIYIFGLHWEAVMSISAAAFSTVINVLVKDLIQRPRPTPDLVTVITSLTSYSFPSGHVMFYLVFFGFLWFLVFTLLKPSPQRTLLLAFAGSLILLVGLSRIYLGEHWASDTLGSYLLGTLTLVAVIQVYRWGKTRFFVRQPTAPAEKPAKP